MTDQNMFSDDNSQNTGNPGDTSQNDPFADQLGGILNEEGKPKYKDVATALDGLKHSQQFIKDLKGEKLSLEEELNMTKAELEKRRSVEEVFQSLTQGKPQQPVEPGKTNANDSGLNEDKVMQLVQAALNQQTNTQREAANFQRVSSELTAKYGEQAREVIRTRAKELNTTPTDLERLAKTNPDLVLGLFGGVAVQSNAPSKSTQTPPRGLPDKGIDPPKRGLINGGAPMDDLLSEMRAVRDDVYKKYDVQT